MCRLTLCLPFYRAPRMLAEQYLAWASYPPGVECVVVDDGSPEPAADVPRPAGLPLRIYRVLEDRPWHQHAARNLAAREAAAPWLLLTDVDHVMPTESLAVLLAHLQGDAVYRFPRVDAGSGTALAPAPNVLALRRDRFWAVGGYDERLCGFYGTDWQFLRRLPRPKVLDGAKVVSYGRDVVPDASQDVPREPARRRAAQLEALARRPPVPPCAFRWRLEPLAPSR